MLLRRRRRGLARRSPRETGAPLAREETFNPTREKCREI
jgi:hypothetical protein